MQIDPNNLQNLAQRQMFDDPSGGMFNQRLMYQFFMMTQNTNMNEKERGDVFDLLHVITLKFVSVWTHDQRFEKRQNELIAVCKADPIDRRKNVPMRFISAQDLYIEWDGFLVQCKSVLDHMVNILHYAMFIKFSALTSFKSAGDGVIKLLGGNVGKNPPGAKKAAQLLIKHIQANQNWLRSLIDARDRMNHFAHGGMNVQAFGVASIIERDGVQSDHVPKFNNEQTVKDTMSNVLGMLLEFVEYFLGMSIAVRAPDYAIRWKPPSDDEKAQRWEMIHGAVVSQMIASGQLDPRKIQGLT